MPEINDDHRVTFKRDLVNDSIISDEQLTILRPTPSHLWAEKGKEAQLPNAPENVLLRPFG
jgi:hypothetical protein